MSIEDDVREILANNRGASRLVLRALAEYVESFQLISEALPRNTHAEIGQVEAYGLELGIDANGYATRVRFPYGAHVE